jgi:Spy/CpxP family protein refolding chaperone
MLLAQGPMGPAGGGFGREQGGQRSAMRGRKGMMGQLMAGYLGLTDAQKAQFKTIQQNARAQAQPIRDQLRQNRQDLHAAIKAGQPVDAIAAEQGKLLGQMIAIRANTREQFLKLLTPEQLAKLDQLQANRGNKGSSQQPAPPANQ